MWEFSDYLLKWLITPVVLFRIWTALMQELLICYSLLVGLFVIKNNLTCYQHSILLDYRFCLFTIENYYKCLTLINRYIFFFSTMSDFISFFNLVFFFFFLTHSHTHAIYMMSVLIASVHCSSNCRNKSEMT